MHFAFSVNIDKHRNGISDKVNNIHDTVHRFRMTHCQPVFTEEMLMH